MNIAFDVFVTWCWFGFIWVVLLRLFVGLDLFMLSWILMCLVRLVFVVMLVVGVEKSVCVVSFRWITLEFCFCTLV